ncbi:unnamed protein product [Lampetra planeri]
MESDPGWGAKATFVGAAPTQHPAPAPALLDEALRAKKWKRTSSLAGREDDPRGATCDSSIECQRQKLGTRPRVVCAVGERRKMDAVFLLQVWNGGQKHNRAGDDASDSGIGTKQIVEEVVVCGIRGVAQQ